MTRVTDAELERMTAMLASDVTDDRLALLGDAVRAELLALRKVADAAVEMRENGDLISAYGPEKELLAALEGAGL